MTALRWLVVIFAIHVATVVGLYHLRVTSAWWVLTSDTVLFGLIPVVALVGCVRVLRHRGAGPLPAIGLALLVAFVGHFVGMLVAVNTWGV
jgi:hypothetical protein